MILASVVSMLLEARKFAFLPEGKDSKTEYFSGFSGGDHSPIDGLTTLYLETPEKSGFQSDQ